MSATRFHASWTSAGALATEQEAWLDLMKASAEPNPFYAPDTLLAAERHLHPERPIRCLILRDGDNADRLCALLPLDRPLLADGMAGLAWAMYRNAYTCLTTPLIERGLERPVLAAALEFLMRAPGPGMLALSQLVEGGAIAVALGEIARDTRRPLLALATHPRAIVQSELAPDAYRRSHWNKAHRSKMRRKLDMLKSLGEVAFSRTRGSGPEGRAMVEAFLRLEAGGWKGRAGTALASKPGTRAFALQAFCPDGAKPDVIFETLTLDARIIAMNVNLIAGDAGFTVKTAYDETYARHSPGFLLDGEAISLACTGGALRWLDSCAAPGHPLEDIWAQRCGISYLLLDLEPGSSITKIRIFARWMRFVRDMLARRHPNAYTTRRGAG